MIELIAADEWFDVFASAEPGASAAPIAKADVDVFRVALAFLQRNLAPPRRALAGAAAAGRDAPPRAGYTAGVRAERLARARASEHAPAARAEFARSGRAALLGRVQAKTAELAELEHDAAAVARWTQEMAALLDALRAGLPAWGPFSDSPCDGAMRTLLGDAAQNTRELQLAARSFPAPAPALEGLALSSKDRRRPPIPPLPPRRA